VTGQSALFCVEPKASLILDPYFHSRACWDLERLKFLNASAAARF
jgi:hypothetical protein